MHRWARTLGATHDELIKRVNARQIQEEMVYDKLDPLPNYWLGVGLVCSLIANVFSGKSKKYKPEDFMPIEKPSEAQNMFNTLKSLVRKRGK